jgi:uncharacterized DUF497 family protein
MQGVKACRRMNSKWKTSFRVTGVTCYITRFVTLGFLGGIAVSIVHAENSERIHVISFRRATRNEEAILFKSI